MIPRTRSDTLLQRGLQLAAAGFFACLVGLSLLLFLPRPRPAAPADHRVDALFLAPKVGLRAGPLAPPATIAEARR